VQSQNIGELMISSTCTTIDTTTPVTATVEVNGFSAGTKFTLLISSKSGNLEFGSLNLTTANLEAGSNTVTFEFFYPLNDGSGTPFGSDSYVATAVNTNTGQDGLLSDSFSVYIYDNTELLLLPRNNCSITTLSASPDNLLLYNWYRFDPITGEEFLKTTTVNTFTPDLPGRYFFRPDLGNCEEILRVATSNESVIDDGNSANLLDFTISSSSATNTICADQNITLTSSLEEPTFSYQWFKDDIILAGKNESSITVTGLNSEGNYRLDITNSEFGFDSPCRTSTSMNQIFIDLLNPTIELQEPFEVILIPGNTTTLTAEITGTNTTIQWFRDGNPITNAINVTLDVNTPGIYTAAVTGTSRCDENTVLSQEEIEVIPFNIQSIIIAYDDPNYSNCTESTVTLNITSINAQNAAGGNITINDQNVINTFPVSWVNQDNIEVSNNSSFTANSGDQNGEYRLEINGIPSNILPVILSLDSIEIESSSESNELTIGEPITLTANISESVKWFRNDVLIDNEISNSIDVNDIGENYRIVYRINGFDCDTVDYQWFLNGNKINGVTTNEFQIDVVGTYTVQISNQQCVQYQWLENNNNISEQDGGNANPLMVNSPGRYKLNINSNECNQATSNEIAITAISAEIPNVITPTLTSNRTWFLPLEFTGNDNIQISIVDPSGKEVLNQTNYNNDWPLDASELEETIYYYIISNAGDELKKGTITILR